MTPGDASGCREIRQSLGVYVVGAIDPMERPAVDRHLAGCSACRDELAGLASLPALLGRVSVAEVERGPDAKAAQPPDQLLDSILARAAAKRRAQHRRHVLLAAAASIVVLAGAGAGATLASQGSGARPHPAVAAWETESGRDRAANIAASVKYRAERWGTQVQAWMAGVPHGTDCQLWVIDSSGRRTMAGGWQIPAAERSLWYPGSTSVPAASIESFEITAHGKTLVAVPG